MADGGKSKPLVVAVDPLIGRRKIMNGGLIRYHAHSYVVPELDGVDGDIFTVHFHDLNSGAIQGMLNGRVLALDPIAQTDSGQGTAMGEKAWPRLVDQLLLLRQQRRDRIHRDFDHLPGLEQLHREVRSDQAHDESNTARRNTVGRCFCNQEEGDIPLACSEEKRESGRDCRIARPTIAPFLTWRMFFLTFRLLLLESYSRFGRKICAFAGR